ncbi:CoA transferase [Ralstonia pickettii]|nr:CoA transferase [Ralstonia pickettii]
MLPADMGAEVIKIETQVGNWAQSARAIERQSGTFLLHAL